MVLCKECGSKLRKGGNYCTRCGAAVRKERNVQHVADFVSTTQTAENQETLAKSKQVAKSVIVKAAMKGLSKSLLLSAITIGPGIAILMAGYTLMGMVWMFFGSFWLMARTYSKPWRLNFVSCFIPPMVALSAYLLQLWLFGTGILPLLPVALAVALGLFFGWWRASKHNLAQADGGGVIAKRTFGFMLVWVLSYGVTQLLGYLSAGAEIIRAGLLTGAFSTTAILILSLILWRKYKSLTSAAVLLIAVMVSPTQDLTAEPLPLVQLSERACEQMRNPMIRADKEIREEITRVARQLYEPVIREIYKNRNFSSVGFGYATTFSKVEGAAMGEAAVEKRINRLDIHVKQLFNKEDDAHMFVSSYFNEKSAVARTSHVLAEIRDDAHNARETRNIGGQTVYRGGYHYHGMDISWASPDKSMFITLRAPSTSSVKKMDYWRKTWGGWDIVKDTNDEFTKAGLYDWWSRIECVPGLGGAASGDSVTEREVVEVTAIITMILIAAGFAVNIAQSIAVAVANALQSVGEAMTSEVAEAAVVQSDDSVEGPKLPEADPDPPLFDPYDNEQIPYENGRYWAAREGEGGKWLSREEAERYLAALQKEKAAWGRMREQEIAHHDGETANMNEQWRGDTRQRHAAESEQEQREKQRLRTRRDQIEREGQQEGVVDPAASEADLFGTPGIDNTGLGWAVNVADEFIRGSVTDSIDLVVETPGALAELARKAAAASVEVLSEPENWRIAGETLADTLGDIVSLNPLSGDLERTVDTWGKVYDGGSAAAEVAGHLAKEAWKDPAGAAVGVGKAVLGTDNWEKVIDPDVHVTERMGRAIWGTIDTGGALLGGGAAAVKGVSKLGDLMRVADTTGDLMRGAKVVDAVGDVATAARTADSVSDSLKGGSLLDGAADGGKVADSLTDIGTGAKATDSLSDTAKAGRIADGDAVKAADSGSAQGRLAELRERLAAERKASGGAQSRETLDEMRARLANQPKGHVNTPEAALKRGDGIPEAAKERADIVADKNIADMKSGMEDYVRQLPSGALVDRNLAQGAGYTGAQIDDMARFARRENVVVGARSTNIDSMRHIRDGTGVPKPITIKSKTIGELDTYLGANPSEKGLVGYFDPPKVEDLDLDKVPVHLREAVLERQQLRAKEFSELRGDIDKAIESGALVERDGKLHAIVNNADGSTSVKPYAGDIDGVYFADATTGELIPPGERYERLKAAWTGNTDEINRQIAEEAFKKGETPDLVPNYWASSSAPGQHGVESNLVADITGNMKPGTPEYDRALAKSNDLHAKLGKNHWDGNGEVVLQMGPDGNLRRGIRFSKDNPLPDLAAIQKTEGTKMPNLSDWISKPKGRSW